MKKSKLFITMLLALVLSLAFATFAACDNAFGKNPDSTTSDSTISGDTTDSTESTDSTDSTESTDSTDSTESTDPTDSTDSTDSTDTTDSTSSEPDVEDVTAPVITIDGNPTTFTVGLNEEFTVPTATAVDDVDGEVDIYIYSETAGAYDGETGKFKTNILGEHVITYYACDEAENETFVEIPVNVTSETYAETFNVTGYNDITVLAQEEGVFKENFEKGLNSPLIYNSLETNKITLEAGERAISGNSLVIDYNALAGSPNVIYFNNIQPLRSGKWTITFDLKIISGKGFSDFYFGYFRDGDNNASKDQQYSLADLNAGDTKQIKFSQLLSLDENSQYYFHMFRLANDYTEGPVVAFDNFVIQYEEKVYTTTTPTFEQLQAGFTYDWENVYMAMDASEPVKVEKIENADAKAAITEATEGFTSTVMNLKDSGAHDLSVIKKAVDPDFFQTDWVYVIEYWYYSVSDTHGYFIAYDGGANNTVKSNVFEKGLHKGTIEYVVGANEYAITFYATANIDVYLGNLKITLKEPVEGAREDFYAPTTEEIQAQGGYTFDFTENNVIELSKNATYLKVEDLEDATLKQALTETNAFTSGYALKYSGGGLSEIKFLTNKVTTGNSYKISFDAYVVSGNLAILPFGAGAQKGDFRFNPEFRTGEFKTFTATVVAQEGTETINFYELSSIELYLANFTVEEIIPAEPAREDFYAPTAEQLRAENGYTFDWAENNIVKLSANASYEKISKLEETLKANLEATGAFTNGYALKYAGNSTSLIEFLSGKLTAGSTYEISFDAYVVTQGSICILAMAGGNGVEEVGYALTSENNITTYKATYVAKTSHDALNMYIVTPCELYLANLTIKETIKVEDDNVQLEDYSYSGTKAWSDCGASGAQTVIGDGQEIAIPAGAVGQKGFAANALQFTTATANVTFPLFKLKNETVNDENYVSTVVTVYYYVVEMNGTGLHINIDNQAFPTLEESVGYHAITLTIERTIDNFSLYFGLNGTGTVIIGSVDYTINTKAAVVKGTKAWSDCGIAAGKFTQVAAPTTEKGFADQALNFEVTAEKLSGPSNDYTMELFRLSDVTAGAGYLQTKITVYYYVSDITNTDLFINLDNNVFEPIPAGVGYHAYTFTTTRAFDFFSLYVKNNVGNIVIGSVDYTAYFQA